MPSPFYSPSPIAKSIAKFKIFAILGSCTIYGEKENLKLLCNIIFTPKSFNAYISHQLFEYKITFVNSQHENTTLKGDFVHKNQFETFVLKISGIQNKSESDLVWEIQLKRIFSLK